MKTYLRTGVSLLAITCIMAVSCKNTRDENQETGDGGMPSQENYEEQTAPVQADTSSTQTGQGTQNPTQDNQGQPIPPPDGSGSGTGNPGTGTGGTTPPAGQQ